jgi:hypothetical protein
VNFKEDNEEGAKDALKVYLTPTHTLCLGLKHIILVATFVFAVIVPLPP